MVSILQNHARKSVDRPLGFFPTDFPLGSHRILVYMCLLFLGAWQQSVMPADILSLSFLFSLLATHHPPFLHPPSSPHPPLHLPAGCPCVSQWSELWLWGWETETLHCFPRWKREHRESQRHRLQRLLLLLFLLFVAEQAALPGLQLYLGRGPVYQSAASRTLWPLPHQREQRNGKWEQLTDQPPFRLCVRLLPLPAGWQ